MVDMYSLTKSQQDFINSFDKFIRLLAPAGCGKTFSIIQKVRSIISQSQKTKITIFTFTRGAADEIRERCDNDMCISVNTINSWGNSYIKSNVLKNAKIISTQKDKKFCILNYLQPVWNRKEYENTFAKLFDKNRSKVKHSETILEIMDNFKNIGFIHTEFTKKFEHDQQIYYTHLDFINRVGLNRYYNTLIETLLHEFGLVCTNDEEKHTFVIKTWIPFWKDCCEQMQASGLYTLDDQKYFANIELSKKVAKGEKWNGSVKIDFIFVDEFQDTSPLDIMLISNLQKLNDSSLIIVGDDDQAIYEFRGATPYFILHPEDFFDNDFVTYILNENFRSPQNIVQKSMDLISHNKKRVIKNVTSKSSLAQAEISLKSYDTQEQMIDAVINDIKDTLNNSTDNIAVLSRLKASLLPYQILLTKENIPYTVSEDLAFFLTGAADSLNRVIPIKARDNKLTREDLIEFVCLSSKHEVYKTARDTLSRLFIMNNVKKDNLREALSAIAAKHPAQFQNLFTDSFIDKCIKSLESFLKASTVYDTLNCLLTNFDGLKQNYSRSLEDIYYRDPPLASLLDFASKYGSDYNSFLEDFNTAIANANAAKDPDDNLFVQETPRVTLSTALRVKGQQYDRVIILNVDDGIWPKSQAKNNNDDYEAERRLFYVATTRPKKVLRLYRADEYRGEQTTISPFVFEGKYNE